MKAVPLRVALYVLAATSAGAALFVEPALDGAVRRGALSGRWLFLPIGVYGLFLVAYAVDRTLLVRRRGYPLGKAMFQVAFALIFALMLLPSTIRDYQHHGVPRQPSAVRLMSHADPQVRAIAALALGFEGQTPERVQQLATLLKDGDASVAFAAAKVLARWSGRSVDDIPGLEAWASALSGTSTVTRGDSHQ